MTKLRTDFKYGVKWSLLFDNCLQFGLLNQ